ncbi:hypothetical protein [Dasania marina]|uniref:hypothetical protein n=1 Tax=Dasania marina TaxID=471499 RepID=UPI0014616D2B|nr:hypothetical protein [Dasania marina]
MHRVTGVVRWLLTIGCVVGLCYSPVGLASAQIIVINSSDAPPYQRTAAALAKHLAASGVLAKHELQILSLAQADTLAALEPGTVIVTLGSAAADYAIQQLPGVPVINSFITHSAYQALHAPALPDQAITAVFMDQPLARLIQLASLLKQDQQPYKIGLLSQADVVDQQLVTAASVSDIEIHSATLLLKQNPIKQIEPLMKHSDVVIVRPSTSLFNRLVAKLVLQLSMRYQTPVIGFSEKYTRAGALLSLYASPDNIGQDTAQLISEWLEASPLDAPPLNRPPKRLPPARYGGHFSLAINARIAKKMSMAVDAQQLSTALQRQEAKNVGD